MEKSKVNEIRRLSRGNSDPAFWALSIDTQWGRIKPAFIEMRAALARNEWSRRMDIQLRADIHFMLIGVRHILVLQREYLRILDDPRIRTAGKEFEESFPHAKDIRDILEHQTEYALGQGRLQGSETLLSEKLASGAPPYLAGTDDPDTLSISVESRQVPLGKLATASSALGRLLWTISSDIRADHPN